MKTLNTSLLLTLLGLISSASFAQDGTLSMPYSDERMQTTVLPLKNSRFEVTVRNAEGKNSLIRLIDKDGKVLVRKPITSNARIRFNIAALPDGIYQVVVTEGTTTYTKDIFLDTTTSVAYRTITLS
ncbi:T9SS type A sorting domain-containing protein [Larkinella bovis]|uniref:T9SS type A sorting domain-containing protein n=1 Tax=Larkinella bovis TaxID=683041 RepID=A0ABW0IF46_9BACT